MQYGCGSNNDYNLKYQKWKCVRITLCHMNRPQTLINTTQCNMGMHRVQILHPNITKYKTASINNVLKTVNVG